MAESETSEIPVLTVPTVEAGEITETLVRVTHLAALGADSIPRILGKAQADAGVRGILAIEGPTPDDAIELLERQFSAVFPHPVTPDTRRAYVERLYDERIAPPDGYSIRDISATRDEHGNPVCYVIFEPEY